MRYIMVTIALLLITACTPKYVVKTHYSSPTTKEGKLCIRDCEKNRGICQHTCDSRYDNCLTNAEKNAKENLPEALNNYDREVSDYNYELDRWEHKRDRLNDDYRHFDENCIKSKKGGYACQRADEIADELSSIYRDKPTRPSRPTLAKEIKKLVENCSRECNCIKNYDNCFTSCGGELSYEKICVENCK